MRQPFARLPLALVTLAVLSLPHAVQAGSADAPEVTDAPDDAKDPSLDIADVWFDANATDLSVHIERGSSSTTVPVAGKCAMESCASAGVSLRVVFIVLKADGTPAPTLDKYAASYVLVRLGPDDPTLTAAAGYYDTAGTGTLEGSLNASVDGTSITVDVPRTHATLALPDPTAGFTIASPYALSYVLTCDPARGCQSQPAPASPAGPADGAWGNVSGTWDRAPDQGNGTNYTQAGTAPLPTLSSNATTPAGGGEPVPAESAKASPAPAPAADDAPDDSQPPAQPVDLGASPSKGAPAFGPLGVAAVLALMGLRRRIGAP